MTENTHDRGVSGVNSRNSVMISINNNMGLSWIGIFILGWNNCYGLEFSLTIVQNSHAQMH